MSFVMMRIFIRWAAMRCAAAGFALVIIGLLVPREAFALTVRTKSDLRMWETVTDRSRPLAWSWADGADTAMLTFSNRLTRAVESVVVSRDAGALRGECGQIMVVTTEEALVVATLVQTAEDVEIARETAGLAYTPGAAGHPITVRTKESREWVCVSSPRIAGFDAQWWNVAGPSGYDVIWSKPPGWHLVRREFEGVVDEIMLKFGLVGMVLLVM